LRAAGQGGVGTLSLSPAQLSFGDVLILSATGGGPSAPETVTLTNTGSAALTVTTIVSSSSLFSETDTCRTSSTGTSPSIAPGGTCTISVVFQPLICGAIAATLTITSDTASNSPQTVSLSGSGTGPCATLSATALTFPSQLVTTTSTAQTVTLTGSGNQPVVILSITAQGVFGDTNNCTTAPIAPGANCTISVTFTPTQGGVTPGFIQVNDNAGPAGQVISLSGTGADFSLSSSPTSNTVSAGGSASYTVTVTPSGGFNQAVSLACSAPPPGVSCSFSPGSVTPNGSSAVTSTVTVATTASGFALPTEWKPESPAGRRGVRILCWCLLADLIALGAVARGTRVQPGRRPVLSWGAIVLGALLLAALAVSGCGGSSAKVSTPVGTYQVLVDGSTSAGSTTVTNPTVLILVVQ
jgi:Abnormal spindle-like microcephaly-assoc'd, ASPM-SPD-2-Hydin